MVTIERARTILKVVEIYDGFFGNLTRHALARQVSSMSRSTVYRCVKRLCDLELLMVVDCGGIKITDSGYEFLDECKELL